MIHPELRRMIESRKPPICFRLEEYDPTTGMWEHLVTFPVLWPVRVTRHRFLFWSWTKTVLDQRDTYSVVVARRKAASFAETRTEHVRIYSINARGASFLVYNDGWR